MKTKVILSLFVLICPTIFAQDVFDSSFGNNGIFVQEDITQGATRDIAFQGNKILCVSYFQDQTTGFSKRTMYRINLDGTLDTSFGDNGVFTDDASFLVNSPGTLVVEGDYIYTVSSPRLAGGTRSDMTISKFTADGVLDTSFGTGGYAAIPSLPDTQYSEGIDLKVDSSGNIIAGGISTSSSLTPDTKFIVAKFMANGTIDSNFGTNGVYQHSQVSGLTQRFVSLIVNDNDSINIIGNLQLITGLGSFSTVIKLTSSGVIDTSFADNGVYNITYSGKVRATSGATLLSNGNIMLHGVQVDAQDMVKGYSTRITSNGVIDTSYGDNGYGEGFVDDSNISYGRMISQGDHYIFIGQVNESTIERIIITRLNLDGTIDTTYGTDGSNFFNSPISDYQSLQLGDVIANAGNFYIAAGAELPNSRRTNPVVVKLLDTTLGIDEVETITDDVALFPNPVRSTSLLSFSSFIGEKGELSITNMLGQKMSSHSIDIRQGKNTFSLDSYIYGLSNGIYHVNIMVDNLQVESIKFVK